MMSVLIRDVLRGVGYFCVKGAIALGSFGEMGG